MRVHDGEFVNVPSMAVHVQDPVIGAGAIDFEFPRQRSGKFLHAEGLKDLPILFQFDDGSVKGERLQQCALLLDSEALRRTANLDALVRLADFEL